MIPFQSDDARQILARTPATLRAMVAELPAPWLHASEGPDGWSPYQVVEHLIHGERTNWIPRARLILSPGGPHRFVPFDRLLAEPETPPVAELLARFATLREASLDEVAGWTLDEVTLARTAIHPDPALGTVTLSQLLATWVAHDLSHLNQITATLARCYRMAVGPWRAYLPLLDTPPLQEG